MDHLRMNNNHIHSFGELVLDKENDIREISLTGNYFEDILYPGTFVCEANKRVVMDNNSFPCDCRLR